MSSEEIGEIIRENIKRGYTLCGYLIAKKLVEPRGMNDDERAHFHKLFEKNLEEWGCFESFRLSVIDFEKLYPNIVPYKNYKSYIAANRYHKVLKK